MNESRPNPRYSELSNKRDQIRGQIVDKLSLSQVEKCIGEPSDLKCWADRVRKVTKSVAIHVLLTQYEAVLSEISTLPRRIELIAGRVKWFNDSKGYGFLETDAVTDIFIHYSALKNQAVKEGDLVLFELVTGPKGPQAFNVVLARQAFTGGAA